MEILLCITDVHANMWMYSRCYQSSQSDNGVINWI